MANNYSKLKMSLEQGDVLTITAFYDFKKNGLDYHKTLHLQYMVSESPDNDPSHLEDFMSEFIEKVFIDGFLKIQSTSIKWRRIVLKTPYNQYIYNLSSNIRGTLEGLNWNPFTVSTFEIQRYSGRNIYLNIYGVPSNVDDRLIESCETMLLEPITLTKTYTLIELIGVRTQSNLNDYILSVIGRGSKSRTYTKLTKIQKKPKLRKLIKKK